MKKYWILLVALLLIVVGLILHFNGNSVFVASNYALGYFAAGQFACGVFAAGQFSIGIFSAGLFSIGVFSLSIFNICIYGLGVFIYAYRKKDLNTMINNENK